MKIITNDEAEYLLQADRIRSVWILTTAPESDQAGGVCLMIENTKGETQQLRIEVELDADGIPMMLFKLLNIHERW